MALESGVTRVRLSRKLSYSSQSNWNWACPSQPSDMKPRGLSKRVGGRTWGADVGGLGTGWGHLSWLPHLYLSVGFLAQMVFLTQQTPWPAGSLLPQSASPLQESPFWLQLLKVPGMGWALSQSLPGAFPLTKQET